MPRVEVSAEILSRFVESCEARRADPRRIAENMLLIFIERIGYRDLGAQRVRTSDYS